MSKLVYKAYRFRLYPNETQRVQMAKTFGSVRFVYNHFLDEWNTSYKTTGKGLSESHCKKALPLQKMNEEQYLFRYNRKKDENKVVILYV